MASSSDDLLDRARNLFEFLARTQQLRETPQRTTSAFEEVYWFGELPEHEALDSAHRASAPEPADPFLHIDRVPRHDPPIPTPAVGPWLVGATTNYDADLTAAKCLPVDMVPNLIATARDGNVWLSDHPHLDVEVSRFLTAWQTWATTERHDAPARELYGQLFSTHQTLTAHAEQFELVLGVGLLAWKPSDHDPVRRHLFTFPAMIQFDEESGRLTIAREPSLTPIKVELDMLDPSVLTNPSHLNELKSDVSDYDLHPLDREAIEIEARRFVNTLDASGFYADDDLPPAAGPDRGRRAG